jgi:hypothetical protein
LFFNVFFCEQEWINNTIKANLDSILPALVQGVAGSHLKVYKLGICELIASPLSGEAFPETLMLDKARFRYFENELRYLSICSTMLVILSTVPQYVATNREVYTCLSLLA